MDIQDVVNVRQPEESDGKNFFRKFILRLNGVADEVIADASHRMHEWNKNEVLRDAVRRGLRPTSNEVVVAKVEQQPDGLTTHVTYSVPVDPTGGAVDSNNPRPAVQKVPQEPEPEYTVEVDLPEQTKP